jgi:hypothetical protein
MPRIKLANLTLCTGYDAAPTGGGPATVVGPLDGVEVATLGARVSLQAFAFVHGPPRSKVSLTLGIAGADDQIYERGGHGTVTLSDDHGSARIGWVFTPAVYKTGVHHVVVLEIEVGGAEREVARARLFVDVHAS